MTTYNLGAVGSTPVTRNSYNLNPSEPTEVFRFRTTGTRNLNIALTDITAGDDADLTLYRDYNNNGVLDTTDRNLGRIASSSLVSNRDDSINLRSQSAGNYFAEVRRYAPGSIGPLNYDFAISSTTSRASNVLHSEGDFGNLWGDRTETGWVGNTDTNDTYRFSLGTYEAVNISLTGLSADADVRVIRDSNNNGLVDSGEVVGTSTRGGSASELISGIDLSGDYFVQVYSYSGNTNYTLTLDHYNTNYA
ncbi:MAG: pre-peptidase C-terminal domain-containing protein [Coleofasciculaceae cyanobacterium]